MTSRVKSMTRKVDVEIGLLHDLQHIIDAYFSDTDFDRDGGLSEASAELSSVIDKHSKEASE